MVGLTSQEKKAILFLSAVALCGMGLDVLSKRFSCLQAITCVQPDIGKVDLNAADEKSLVSVPGIGPRLAGRILQQRTESGGFSQLEELKAIKGISAYRLEKLKEWLYVK